MGSASATRLLVRFAPKLPAVVAWKNDWTAAGLDSSAEVRVPESTDSVPSLLKLMPRSDRLLIAPLPVVEKEPAARICDCARLSVLSEESGPGSPVEELMLNWVLR